MRKKKKKKRKNAALDLAKNAESKRAHGVNLNLGFCHCLMLVFLLDGNLMKDFKFDWVKFELVRPDLLPRLVIAHNNDSQNCLGAQT